MGGGGGGMRARGGDLTAKSISSVRGLIEYLCSGVGKGSGHLICSAVFGRETGARIKRGYLESSGRKNVLRKLLRILYRRLKAGFSVC